MEEKDVNLTIITKLYKKRKLIIATTLTFFAVAIAITFFIPKRYAAHAVVYPTKSNSIKTMVFDADFGFEIHADRLIQLFESDEVKKNLVKELLYKAGLRCEILNNGKIFVGNKIKF